MRLLALDTATSAITVAVHDGEQVLATRTTVDARRHAELLAPVIVDALAAADRGHLVAGARPGCDPRPRELGGADEPPRRGEGGRPQRGDAIQVRRDDLRRAGIGGHRRAVDVLRGRGRGDESLDLGVRGGHQLRAAVEVDLDEVTELVAGLLCGDRCGL